MMGGRRKRVHIEKACSSVCLVAMALLSLFPLLSHSHSFAGIIIVNWQ